MSLSSTEKLIVPCKKRKPLNYTVQKGKQITCMVQEKKSFELYRVRTEKVLNYIVEEKQLR